MRISSENVVQSVVDRLLLVLWLRVREDVVDGPLDLFGYRWGDREMSALWVEAILVGGVLNGDRGTVGSGVLELTLSDDHGFALGSQGLRRALLGSGDSVLGFVGVVVRSFGRDVLRLSQNGRHLVLGNSDRDQSEGYDLKRRLHSVRRSSHR